MKICLLITTYNWEKALELVLLSAIRQSVPANDILIADDGSTEETKKLITEFSKKINIKHIWHADNGFRKTQIINKAILQTDSDYIIQIDGDIIIHKNFIKDHIANAKKGFFIHGSRVLLNKKLTKETLSKKFLEFGFFQKGIKNRTNTINSKFLANICSRKNTLLKGTRGCNFSFWRDDFIAVNGYNEEMSGWGKEDTELSVRLMNKGLIKIQLKFNAVCYHLNHELINRKSENINNTILEETIRRRITFCKKGIKNTEKEITKAIEAIQKGGVILYPTDTIWGIGCDATNKRAVDKIIRIKKRNKEKGLICLANNTKMIEKFTDIHQLKIALPKEATTVIYQNVDGLAENLIKSDKTAAFRIPNDAFCNELISSFGNPIVSTSANISGQPIPREFKEISKEIKDSVDYIVNLREDELMTKPSTILLINEDKSITKIR